MTHHTYRGTVTAIVTCRDRDTVARVLERAKTLLDKHGLPAQTEIRRVLRGSPSILAAAPEAVERIHELLDEGCSITEIARRLTGEGVPTAKGGATWHPKVVSSAVRAIRGRG